MFHKESSVQRRCLGFVGIAILFVLCLILSSNYQASAAAGLSSQPPPPEQLRTFQPVPAARIELGVTDASLVIEVNYGHDWIGGWTTPDASVVVTVAGKGVGTGQADGDGRFESGNFGWTSGQPSLEPGDVVTATADGSSAIVNPVGTIYAQMDTATDIVSGSIDVPAFSSQVLTVSCEIWQEGGGPSIDVPNVAADGGSYTCDFAGQADLVASDMVAVRYTEPDGDSVVNIAQPLDLLLEVNYGHDWVEGRYLPGHTVWLTVTDGVGTIKATVELQTGEISWWNGDTGFSTNEEDLWVPSQPDIEAGDYVYGRVDNGYAATVRMGNISGVVDVDANTIAGNVVAGWLSGGVNANCSVWEENGPGKDLTIDLDSGGAYSCDFDTTDPTWDLLPGQNVGVQYQEPAGHWVINVFQEAAPNMRVEKQVEGGGEVSPGGPVVYTIRYSNEGGATAETIYLTDTLPAGTSYVTDTSGVSPVEGGGQLVWTLGPVDTDEEMQFLLVLTNTASVSNTLHNEIDINTLYDQNQDNNHAEADVHVGEGQPDVYVNKNPSPGDPATGQTMLWEINYGNNGPVTSGPVVLTDTIPENTSIVSWSSENGYGLWTNHSTTSQFILKAPAIPANWGDRILLRLLVGASSGTQLTNTVEITTANDSDLNNNGDQRDDVRVEDPRWDAHVEKGFNWGQLVPGGELEYGIHVRNSGNMAAQVWLTDTLPAGTTFEQGWDCSGSTCQPLPPAYKDDQIAVWNMGLMQPGQWQDVNVRLTVDSDTAPGTVLTNCATIDIDGNDTWPYDNEDCVVDAVYSYGPNLRIDKYYQWNGEGQIQYSIEFKNVGSTTLNDVDIVDTLPADTTFTGNWWTWFWEEIQFAQDGNQLTWTIDQLEPTQSSGLGYDADLDGSIVGQQGLCFSNMAEAPITGDVWPDDNSAQVTACTGPDVYVEKWLSDGEPRPGEIVTFTVEFGNHNRWPWNGDENMDSHITETLPTGMTFITATTPWNPDDRWQPESVEENTVVWRAGTMWSDSWWRFDVAAQITDTAEGGDILTNVVEARGDSPEDVEPDDDNNVFELPVTVLAPVFTVAKVYDSNKVAGSPVTYTLTVTNVGTEAGTNVLLGDEVPTGVTYGGSDGSLVSGSVNWTFSSIAAAGGISTGWFSGTLACAGTVTNDTYRVMSSDQGVDTADGSPVSFAIVAPTLSPAFDQSETRVDVGETVDLSDASDTDGGAITAWKWDFGDGHTASGAEVSHAYDAPGQYDVTLTITDTCDYTESKTILDAVVVANYQIFLPTVLKNVAP